jgi:hypothetical protein
VGCVVTAGLGDGADVAWSAIAGGVAVAAPGVTAEEKPIVGTAPGVSVGTLT